MAQLQIPDGMSMIARTAGIGRSAEELQWDLNYLLQLWRAIEAASQSGNPGQPMLIYLESSLVIRAIRDYFQPDIGEILIDTTEIYDQARAFMDIVMPDNVSKVKRYHDDVPLFSRFQIEHQIETAYSRTVPLPSGGAIVIDHTEALVAIDVNSARATKGADIEETATRTNLEAADEVARQLRLRDLGGLIVIDFIDMESAKSQREVEQRLKDALKHDRARVQMGKISRFGLMELSRQRLRPALSEGSHVTCPRCNGTGHIRDTESSALQVLRIIQEEAMKENTAAIHCQVPVEVTAFLLNEKRQEINKIESRFKVGIVLIPNKHLDTPHYKLERLRHDDARLDDPRASWKMAEEAARELESETGYSKRAADVKPKQEAAVKGITPERPAPSAAPQRPVEPVAAPAPAPVAAASGGFIGWLKGLFGMSPAPAPAPAAPAPAKEQASRPARERAEKAEQRGERGGDRNRNRRGGAQQAQGGRDQAANGRGQPQRQEREGKEAREPRDGREGRESREGRGQRDGREPREPREGRDPREPRESREPREPRERTEQPEAVDAAGRGERPDRGERRERGERRKPTQHAATLETVTRGESHAETEADKAAATALPGADAAADAEAGARDGEERRRRRRGRRGGRREREDEGAVVEQAAHGESAVQAVTSDAAIAAEPARTEAPAAVVAVAAAGAVVAEAALEQHAEPVASAAADAQSTAAVEVAAARAEAAPAAPVEQPAAVQAAESVSVPVAPAAAVDSGPVPVAVSPTDAFEVPVAVEAPQPAPVAQIAPAVTTEAAPAAAEPAPVAAAPIESAPADAAPVQATAPAPAPAQPIAAPASASLDVVLQQAGLVWVNTDADKLRAAQEAAARLPRPVRTPRERKPLPPVDTTPMQQVETIQR